MHIIVRRLYDELDSSPDDGEYRILADRLWPRGVKKQRLAYNEWPKELAPSTELRTAFHAGDLPFDEFARQYESELSTTDVPHELLSRVNDSDVNTLVVLVGAKDANENHGVVLANYLRKLKEAR